MTFKRLIFLLISLTTGSILFAQERVVFRTDRDTYIAGEYIWIAAECLTNNGSTPSDLSKVIYIEVTDRNNIPVKQLKLRTIGGKVSTRFELPETMKTGNYIIRGYTKWMRNYNPGLFFTKAIAVINPFKQNSFPESDKVFKTDTAVFYPEGGKLIQNINNKITLQTLDIYGNGTTVSGEILSPSGESILKTETSLSGFATINFVPKEKGTYTFRYSNKNITVPLPDIQESGVVLKLSDDSNIRLNFMVAATGLENESDKGAVHIVTSNGEFIKSYPVQIKNMQKVSVDKTVLPGGYLVAVLLNSKGSVLSSRYFTAKLKTDNTLPVKTNDKKYLPRSKVSVEIKNNGLKHVTVSVVKKCLLNYKPQTDIINRPGDIPLQTVSEICGDNLLVNDFLLCFNPFDNILANPEKTLFVPEMKGEIISGTVTNTETGKPVANKVFILSFVSKIPTISFSETDSAGRFIFTANRYGEQEIVIQPFSRDTTGLKYRVNLDMEFCTKYSKHKIRPLTIDTENIKEINRSIVDMQINALYSPFSPFQAIEKDGIKPLCFYGEPEESVQIDKFIELPTMEEIISEIVPFTFITRKKGRVQINISENESSNPRQSKSFCMVDGVPVRDHGKILNIDYRDVEKTDVVNLNYFIGNHKLGYILNIITRNGDMSTFDFDKRLFRQVHKGYSPLFGFNSPNYSSDSLSSSRIPDMRNLLYWNPEVSFDKNGEAEISFYTSDETTEYTIVVEGINSEGIIEQRLIPLEVTNN